MIQGYLYLIVPVVVIYWLAITAYRALFTPLYSIPGPWYAKFTNLVLKYHVIIGRRMHYIHHLHQQHGAIIRIAPHEIDVADPQAYKELHRVGGKYTKDPWYHSFRTGDSYGLFTMLDAREHAARRKLFAPLWTNSALHEHWEGMVVEKVRLTVRKIERDARAGGEADVYKWWTFMTTDAISQLAFGESLGMLEQEGKPQYVEDLEMATKLGSILSEFPIIRYFIKIIPFRNIQFMLQSDDRIHQYGDTAIRDAKSRGLAKANVFSRFLEKTDQGGESELTHYQAAFEAANFIVAGSGTTAVSLTYLVWAVISHPDVQAQLEKEVASLEDGYTDKVLESLPYLNAVIEETLRLYGAAPGSLPRQPPPEGAVLGGYTIPQGTTVSSQAYSLHRIEDVYPNANSFNPSRFIDPSTGAFTPPKTAFAPFGAGSRTCLGVHFARMELRHGAAEFFRTCRGAKMARSMRDEDMDMRNHFLISPWGERCCIEL